jgi:putative photosynthetic complex assembly protein 2
MGASQYGLPVLYALFLWWFSTGLILYLDGLPRRTFRWTMLGATALLVVALGLLAADVTDRSVFGVYLAFTCGLAVWGWNEVAFLLGYLSGPNRQPCPDGVSGWPRLVLAVRTILYHELAILAGAAVLAALTWDAPNQIATWTYLLLWGMRLSTKINVFLGVPNLSEEFLPAHLDFLPSYFRRRPMNLFFPVAVTVSTLLLFLLVYSTAGGGADAYAATGMTFLATMVALGLLEHWFLVLPLPASALWSWGLRSRGADPTDVGAVVAPVCAGASTRAAPSKNWRHS